MSKDLKKFIPEDIVRMGKAYLNLTDEDKCKVYLGYSDALADKPNGYIPRREGWLNYPDENGKMQTIKIQITQSTLIKNKGYTFREGGFLFVPYQSSNNYIESPFIVTVAGKTSQGKDRLYEMYKASLNKENSDEEFLFNFYIFINSWYVYLWEILMGKR